MSYVQRLLDLFKITKRPAKSLPSPILLLARNRSGISQTRISNEVIAKLPQIRQTDEPEETYVRVLVDAIVKEILENGKIEVAVNPGAVTTIVTGTSPVGPIAGSGQNPAPFKATGVIQ